MANDESLFGAVLAGGIDGPRSREGSIVFQRPAAVHGSGGAAAGPWPAWARPQLERAVGVADGADDSVSVASLLYREWFNPVVVAATPTTTERRPLAGIYRAAHAGSRTRIRSGGVSVVGRRDVIRPGGWWQTWGEEWIP